MRDIHFEVPALAAEVADVVTDAAVQVTYTAGAEYEKQSGRVAVLAVIVANSNLNNGPIEPMRELAVRIAPLALRWLQENERAIRGTAVDIMFADAKQFGPLSMFNALETISFELTPLGELSLVERDAPREVTDSIRRLRYWLSGRRPPRE